MRFRKLTIGAVAVVALVVGPATAATAVGESSTPPPDSPRTFAPMIFGGYDAEVAEANGFKVVTDEDGTQRSIPVTDAAAAQLEKADELRADSRQKNTALAGVGNCGSSWATGSKIENDTVAFNTGFLVFLAAYEHTWTVYANGFFSANSWTTSGPGPTSGSENWTGAIGNVSGPGFGGVPLLSASASVVLVNGSVCYSVGPTFAFS